MGLISDQGRSGIVDSLREMYPTLRVLPRPLDNTEIQVHFQLPVRKAYVVHNALQVVLLHIYLLLALPPWAPLV